MTQKISPFVEGKYGWDFGESGWNSGMDENLLKFSFLFDRNVDSIGASLPTPVNGQAHYNTSDNRLYFVVGSTYYSTPVPKWFIISERDTGSLWQFDGSGLVEVETPEELVTRLDAVELTLSALGTAAFEDSSVFATQAALDVAVANSEAYTDALSSSLEASTGAGLVGYGGSTVESSLTVLENTVAGLSEVVLRADVSSSATALENKTTLENQISLNPGATLYFPNGVFNVNQIEINSEITFIGSGENTVIRLSDGAGGHLLVANAKTTIKNLTLDQNRQNNPDRMKSAISCLADSIEVREIVFTNTMFAGIHIPLVDFKSLKVFDCTFKNMAEHSGVMGEQSQAINCRTTSTDCVVLIRGGSVVHGTPLDVDAVPGGFIFDGTQAYKEVEVSGVTFTNIGQRKANNYIGSIDFYTHCRNCIVTNNKVFNYYYAPFKFQNCQKVVMSGNLVNGAADAAANQAVVFQNARDYQFPVTEFTCTGNILVGTSNLTDAIYVQGDPDRVHQTENVTITGNVISGFRYGVNMSYARVVNMSNNDINSCTIGVYIRDLINGSTFSITGGSIASCTGSAVQVLGASSSFQTNLSVVGTTLRSNTPYHIDTNYAARLTVSGCTLIGSPTNDVRAVNNGLAVITGNNNGTVTASLSITGGTTKQAGNSWN